MCASDTLIPTFRAEWLSKLEGRSTHQKKPDRVGLQHSPENTELKTRGQPLSSLQTQALFAKVHLSCQLLWAGGNTAVQTSSSTALISFPSFCKVSLSPYASDMSLASTASLHSSVHPSPQRYSHQAISLLTNLVACLFQSNSRCKSA